MNKQNKEVYYMVFLAYIMLNGVSVGMFITSIQDAINGEDATRDIILAGALSALTLMRTVHYHKLTKEK